jgi:hypothetical protein
MTRLVISAYSPVRSIVDSGQCTVYIFGGEPGTLYLPLTYLSGSRSHSRSRSRSSLERGMAEWRKERHITSFQYPAAAAK